MNTRGKFIDLKMTNSILITFQLDTNTDLNSIDELINKDLDIEVKQHKEKRSNDANAYMWKLSSEIAKKLGGKTTKEDIYKKAIRDVGVFETIPVRKDAVKRYTESWEKNGTGWVCESLGRSKLEGYENIRTYYGSSTYDAKEMSRLIDYIVEECKEQGIETIPPNELASMKEAWGSGKN